MGDAWPCADRGPRHGPTRTSTAVVLWRPWKPDSIGQTAPHEWVLVDKMGRTLAGLIKTEGSGVGEAGEYYIKNQAEDRLVKCSSLREAQEIAEALADADA